MASVMAVSNETKSTSTRITKEGRKLTYKLSVMQQPERARACGSGAKCMLNRLTMPTRRDRLIEKNADR